MTNFNIPHYFSRKIGQETQEVYWHSFLANFALSLVFIFEPIYLYSLGYNLTQIMWFYVQVYVWYIVLISFGAKFASKYGYKHSILVANIFYVIYWIVLVSIKTLPALFFIAPIFFALQKSWFWTAYDAEIALSSVKIQRGREVGVLFSLIQLSFIVGPFLGGFVSEKFGFMVLFILAAVTMLLSAYPLFYSPEIYSRHKFQLKNLWPIFRKNTSNFFGYWGFAEDLMVMSLWPVYMFIVIPDFLEVGSVSTIATVIGTVLMLYIGRLADRTSKRKLISQSAIFYGSTWILRFAGRTLPTVLAFDALTKAGKDVLNVPMQALTFEKAGSGGPDHAVAYSVFYEMSLSVGKIITALAAIAILANGGSIFLVFALTGVLTLFYGFLK